MVMGMKNKRSDIITIIIIIVITSRHLISSSLENRVTLLSVPVKKHNVFTQG